MSKRVLRRSGERGIVMIVALIVLVVMALAGVTMLRQLSSGVSIAGNVSFKENATSAADSGTEAARAWYMARDQAVLSNDNTAAGYYSSWSASDDPSTFDWAGGSVEVNPALNAGTGNTVRYIIHRLCASAGVLPNDPAQRCSDAVGKNTGPSHVGGSYGNLPITPPPKPFFRFTTRVDGPRNTVSYIQVLMH